MDPRVGNRALRRRRPSLHDSPRAGRPPLPRTPLWRACPARPPAWGLTAGCNRRGRRNSRTIRPPGILGRRCR
eukprot:7167205-Lingulodinium_polyedra.AAC.1